MRCLPRGGGGGIKVSSYSDPVFEHIVEAAGSSNWTDCSELKEGNNTNTAEAFSVCKRKWANKHPSTGAEGGEHMEETFAEISNFGTASHEVAQSWWLPFLVHQRRGQRRWVAFWQAPLTDFKRAKYQMATLNPEPPISTPQLLGLQACAISHLGDSTNTTMTQSFLFNFTSTKMKSFLYSTQQTQKEGLMLPREQRLPEEPESHTFL